MSGSGRLALTDGDGRRADAAVHEHVARSVPPVLRAAAVAVHHGRRRRHRPRRRRAGGHRSSGRRRARRPARAEAVRLPAAQRRADRAVARPARRSRSRGCAWSATARSSSSTATSTCTTRRSRSRRRATRTSASCRGSTATSAAPARATLQATGRRAARQAGVLRQRGDRQRPHPRSSRCRTRSRRSTARSRSTPRASASTTSPAQLGGGDVTFGGRIGLNGFTPGDAEPDGRPASRCTPLSRRASARSSTPTCRCAAIRPSLRAAAAPSRCTTRVYTKRFEPNAGHLQPDRRRRGAVARRGPAAPTLPLRFDVRSTRPSTLRIENNLARIVASADLPLQGTYDRPVLLRHAPRSSAATSSSRATATSSRAARSTSPTRRGSSRSSTSRRRRASAACRAETYRVTLGFTGTLEQIVDEPQLRSAAAGGRHHLAAASARPTQTSHERRAAHAESVGRDAVRGGSAEGRDRAAPDRQHLGAGQPRRRADARRRPADHAVDRRRTTIR